MKKQIISILRKKLLDKRKSLIEKRELELMKIKKKIRRYGYLCYRYNSIPSLFLRKIKKKKKIKENEEK